MTCSLGNMRGCICILACSRVRFISIFFVFFHQKQQLFVFSFLMDREIYHTLYVSFTIIIMCSLCITSITNINARLSAGGGGRGQDKCSLKCACVSLSCKYVCLAYMCVFCKERILRGTRLRTNGDRCDITLHGEKGRNALS